MLSLWVALGTFMFMYGLSILILYYSFCLKQKKEKTTIPWPYYSSLIGYIFIFWFIALQYNLLSPGSAPDSPNQVSRETRHHGRLTEARLRRLGNQLGGSSSPWGYPNIWLVYFMGKSHEKMDDDWGYPYDIYDSGNHHVDKTLCHVYQL